MIYNIFSGCYFIGFYLGVVYILDSLRCIFRHSDTVLSTIVLCLVAGVICLWLFNGVAIMIKRPHRQGQIDE